MIVDRQSLDVRPLCDELLKMIAGEYVSEVGQGDISWSNELALHVVELKTGAPVHSLSPLPEIFHTHIREINRRLEPLNAQLMPTAMHPWMDPAKEVRLWPHEYNPIYHAYDRIFDCRGHGWGNLQSMHINLPFDGDEEFGRLHAAIRLILPLIPALAASSPITDGTLSGCADRRLEVYRTNAARIPSITGWTIPERIYTESGYRHEILQRMYKDIAPFDPDNILQEEWLNSRGAIARFDRNTIEIRLPDVQECPAADLAIAGLVTGVVEALTKERWSRYEDQKEVDEKRLYYILTKTIKSAEEALIDDVSFLKLFGFNETGPVTAGGLWRHIVQEAYSGSGISPALNVILEEGTLSTRIRKRLPERPDRHHLKQLYNGLCYCLAMNIMLFPRENPGDG